MRIIIKIESFTCNCNEHGLVDTRVWSVTELFLSGHSKLCVSIVLWNTINLSMSVIIHKLFCKLLRIISSLQCSILICNWDFFSWWTKFLIVLIFISFNDCVCVVFGPIPAGGIETNNRYPLGVNSPKTNMLNSEMEMAMHVRIIYRIIYSYIVLSVNYIMLMNIAFFNT